MLGPQARRKLRGDARRRSKEEQPETTTRAHGRKERDEVDAGDRRADRAALAPGRPNHAGSVCKAEVGGFQDPGELAVAARPYHKLGVERGGQGMAGGFGEVV